MSESLQSRLTPDINCGNCVGACCRTGMAIPLTRKEAGLLETAGTDMRIMTADETQGNRAGWRRDFYLLEGDCGNLDPETAECAIYEARPRACREFAMGSLTCEMARQRNGVVDLAMPTFPEE